MNKAFMSVLLLVFIATSVWAAPIGLKSAKIEPEQAKVRQTVTVTVEFTGNADDIQMVELIVRENPYDAPEMYLQPKKDSDANIWVLSAPVPEDAPYGDYHLEVKALTKDGKDVVTKEYKDQEWGKAGLILFKVIK